MYQALASDPDRQAQLRAAGRSAEEVALSQRLVAPFLPGFTAIDRVYLVPAGTNEQQADAGSARLGVHWGSTCTQSTAAPGVTTSSVAGSRRVGCGMSPILGVRTAVPASGTNLCAGCAAAAELPEDAVQTFTEAQVGRGGGATDAQLRANMRLAAFGGKAVADAATVAAVAETQSATAWKEALDAVYGALYPMESNVPQATAMVKWADGGPDPLDFIR